MKLARLRRPHALSKPEPVLVEPRVLNDVHSQLNPSRPARVESPRSLAGLQDILRRAKREGRKVAVAGGCHAMGGQQFLDGAVQVDMTALDAVLNTDAVRGLLHIEAGAMWPAIIAASHALRAPDGREWGIRQKQTGVDTVTLGGSISANAHGRGLTLAPMIDDIEDITLVDADGEVRVLSREHHAEWFSLVAGGYGLFGAIYSATLRLAPRQRVERVVDIIDLDDAMGAVYRRVAEGCVYGDFQFVIDAGDPRFLKRGVFACYRPVGGDADADPHGADLNSDAWLKLLKLAHENKREAFRLYSQHYLSTDGCRYWSDTMQLSTYIPSYAEFLESARPEGLAQRVRETLVIGEHYVPHDRLLDFMARAREILRVFGTEVIYGTIRAIARDTTSFLPWAKDDYACVIFNLRTPHDAAGIARTAATFRALTDAGNALGGSFFLTYHRFATAAQVASAYPQFPAWLRKKRDYDPEERFCSAWYLHYRDAFAARMPAAARATGAELPALALPVAALTSPALNAR
ncbi:MAG: FAD-binding oxidoreductase [Betaproteobacteria bacterium]|nr:FAD-binding oxidoreductase [Betaproteobacteria bacterium]